MDDDWHGPPDRPDVLPGTRLPWMDWEWEEYQQSYSFVPGWPPDERDMIRYWEPGDAHEVRLSEFADGVFAYQVKSCHWGRYCGTRDVPADQLWVVKIKHDRFVKGYLYTMCWQHLLVFKQGRYLYATDPHVPREDVLPGTRLPWADWSEERYMQSDSFVPGWPPDERDMVRYWPADAVRKDLFADGVFAHQMNPCGNGQHETPPMPADQLWVFKTHHPKHPKGYLRTYCWPCYIDYTPSVLEPVWKPQQVCPIHFVEKVGGVCDQCE